MSNVTPSNYKQRLDSILRNCRQSNQQAKSPVSVQPASCKAKTKNYQTISPFSTSNKLSKPELFTSYDKNSKPHNLQNRVATEPHEIEVPQHDKLNQARYQRQNRTQSTFDSQCIEAPSNDPKIYKLCDLLDQLIKDADVDRKALQMSANHNMPLQPKQRVPQLNIMKENRHISHKKFELINTICQSDEENDISKPVKNQNIEIVKLRNQVICMKNEIYQKDLNYTVLHEEFSKLKIENEILLQNKNYTDFDNQKNLQFNIKLQEQKDQYNQQIADVEKERSHLEEVLKHFLLQRELNKFKVFGGGLNDTSAQFQSFSFDDKHLANNSTLNATEIMQYVENKNLSKVQLLLPNQAELQRIKDSSDFLNPQS